MPTLSGPLANGDDSNRPSISSRCSAAWEEFQSSKFAITAGKIKPLFPVVILITLGLGLTTPLSPTIMLQDTVSPEVWSRTRGCEQLSEDLKNDPDCDRGIAKYSLNAGLAGGFGAILGFLLAPSFGKYSDAHGRRRLFTFTSFLTNMPPVCLYLVFHGWVGLWVFFVALFCLLVSPTIIAFLAYISDKTKAEEKSIAFGLVLGTIGMMTLMGALMAGFAFDVNTSLIIAMICTGTGTVYTFLFLPESLAEELRTPFPGWNINPIQSFAILRRDGLHLFRYALIYSIVDFADQGVRKIATSYTQRRYHFEKAQFATETTIVGVGNFFTQVVLLPLMARAGLSDRSIVTYGLFMQAGSLTFSALAPNEVLYFISVFLFTQGAAVLPVVAATMTKRVGLSEQGELTSAVGGVTLFFGAIGTVIFSLVFSLGLNEFGLVNLGHFVAVGFLILGLALVLQMPQHDEPNHQSGEDLPPINTKFDVGNEFDSVEAEYTAFEEERQHKGAGGGAGAYA